MWWVGDSRERTGSPTSGDVRDGDQLSREAATGRCLSWRLRTAAGTRVVEERGPGLSALGRQCG